MVGDRPRQENFMFTLILKIADVWDVWDQYLQSRNASDSSDHIVKIADCLGCLEPGEGEGHFQINLHGTCCFSGYHFQHKFLNGIWKLVRNSETGYYYLIKNKRLLFSLLFFYCFVIKNSETEYQNAFFS